MSVAALRTLIDHEQALIAALDGDDAAAIERRSADVAQAIAALGAIPADARPLAEQAMALAGTARARLATLADRTQARLSAIAAVTGRGNAGATYGPDARVRR